MNDIARLLFAPSGNSESGWERARLLIQDSWTLELASSELVESAARRQDCVRRDVQRRQQDPTARKGIGECRIRDWRKCASH